MSTLFDNHVYCLADPSGSQDRGERLEVYESLGTSKKAAKEEAAMKMALSGHCVSDDIRSLSIARTEQGSQ